MSTNSLKILQTRVSHKKKWLPSLVLYLYLLYPVKTRLILTKISTLLNDHNYKLCDDIHPGGHTIGRSHCTSFSNRLYNFNGTTSQDPTLDATYATSLKQMCPQGSTDPSLVVPMNPGSPATTDAGYYLDILANRGLFTSDQTLLTNAATATQVNINARNSMLWKRKFAAAMQKMGKLDVLTGNAGEIRADCRVINS